MRKSDRIYSIKMVFYDHESKAEWMSKKEVDKMFPPLAYAEGILINETGLFVAYAGQFVPGHEEPWGSVTLILKNDIIWSIKKVITMPVRYAEKLFKQYTKED